jgi:hypothetical protein
MMNRFGLRSVASIGTVLTVFTMVAGTLWSLSTATSTVAAEPVAAPSAPAPSRSVDDVRQSFLDSGFQVDETHTWDWTNPPFTSLQVHDPTSARVLLVLVYPSSPAAETALRQAQANEAVDNLTSHATASGVRSEPHLVQGYGPSVWNLNVAMVQTTQPELDHLFQAQLDNTNGVATDVNSAWQRGPIGDAVDFDFQQALDSSAANL